MVTMQMHSLMILANGLIPTETDMETGQLSKWGFFPNDPTQWSDFDGDGFGDNSDGNNGDQCPELHGQSTIRCRGCPDSDNDGVVDPFDAFPEDFYQQTDKDNDGWGDNHCS